MMRALVLLYLLATTSCRNASAGGFDGEWETSFGPLTLDVSGAHASGSYISNGARGTVIGTVTGRRFAFQYAEPAEHGEGWFELAADGASFTGAYREGSGPWHDWTGKRAVAQRPTTFGGLWDTTFGRLRLVDDAGKVKGIYAFTEGSSVDGTVTGNKLSFKYTEPAAHGEGWFELAPDGQSFVGKWRADGNGAWQDWSGKRVVPQPGQKWLIVFEAYWERDLSEPPYAFGEMLEAFFRRTPALQVRRRAFSGPDDLRRWGRELAFLAEPAVVVISTHADENGLTVRGTSIGAKEITAAFEMAPTVELVHFAACAVMKGKLGQTIFDALGHRFPISGYTTNVDWAQSAILEFAYYDLILSRGLLPEAAYADVLQMLPAAGDKTTAGWSPAGLRLLR